MSLSGSMAGQGLAALEARLAEDFSLLELPAKNWVPARSLGDEPVRDVVVVGAGMCGLTAAGAMKRLGLHNMVLFDQAPAGKEGPWATFARMRTLRSPKTLTGPSLGMAALTFRAWYEAQFGREGWEALGKIPRLQWMDYLIWYRRVLDLPVLNDHCVTAVEGHGDDLLAVSLETPTGPQRVLTRRLVMATGRDGLGGYYVPPLVEGMDRRFWAHSAEDIDFEALRGKRVGVVGAGASAMDNAAVALETGAASVDLFIRRPDIPRINKLTGIGSPGLVHGFRGLPDEWKWRFLHYAGKAQVPPPRPSTLRVSEHPNAYFHLGSPVERLAAEGDTLWVTTPKGRYPLDFLIFATGFHLDFTRHPELARFAPHILQWQDRFAPPADEPSLEMAEAPYLGPDYEFLSKDGVAADVLARIHCFNNEASLSHGKLSGDIPAVSEGADRLARGIARRLFVEDRARHFVSLQAFATPELQGDEWTDADAEPQAARAAAQHR